jgi:DNA-directed RNA polymerase specialized sigma24 family protein
VPAELAGQRLLLERAATGDREAFALLYDTQVTGVYRYILAWTGSPAEAADLTAQVFHSATGRLPAAAGSEGEASAWLTAKSRDALAQRQAAAGPGGDAAVAGDVVLAAVARLREPEREMAILRLLLGHSLDHTAHLSGYSHRAAMELQLAACLAVHELTTGTPPGGDEAPSAEEFERRLGLREADLTGRDRALAGVLTSMDLALAGALTAASALRRAASEHVADPPSGFVQRLRRELVTGTGAVDGREQLPVGSAPVPIRGPQRSEVAGSGPATRARRSASSSRGDWGVVGWLGRRPWVATAVATTGIVVVLTLQAFVGSGQPAACAGPDCAAPTTRAVAAGGRRSVGTPLTTEKESSTTSSTLAADPVVAPSSAVPRTSAATVPPSTRPPTTEPPTTAASRPTTTTAPTTTAPPTTAPATTTTVAPAPT